MSAAAVDITHAGDSIHCGRGGESLGLDVGCSDHLGPHLDLRRDAGPELLRRAGDHVVAERDEPLFRANPGSGCCERWGSESDSSLTSDIGHSTAVPTLIKICPLLKVDRLCHRAAVTSQFDPKLT